MKATISQGNSKLGDIPNVSFAPGSGCLPGVPCLKECYAMKAYRMYPSVKTAWDTNTVFAKIAPDKFYDEVDKWLTDNNPDFFRWFVSGDPGAGNLDKAQNHYHLIVKICKRHPNTKFLMFTKFHALKEAKVDNLTVVYSMWNGYGNSRRRCKAWMNDKFNPDPRIPVDAIHCPGKCDSCGMCWNLKKLNRDVVFNKH